MSQSYLNYPIHELSIDSRDYPAQLRQLHDPPPQLYYRGLWDNHFFDKALAIVGSRRVTSYGERVLDMLIPNLVAEGVTIISGFMYGTDTLAHQKTLECGGKTIAVLGGGLNVLYPPENEKMYIDIVSKTPLSSPLDRGDSFPPCQGRDQGWVSRGLIISEYPPDQQPQLWTFPQRNRIVAALSTLGVLVIEAGDKSGSLVTAKLATKLGKPLFAIPGPITSSVSRGTNQLIKDGLAKMVVSSTDIVGVDLCVDPKNTIKQIPDVDLIGRTRRSAPTNTESQILSLLSLEPLTLDEIALKLNKNIIELGQILTLMSLRGAITETNSKYSSKS